MVVFSKERYHLVDHLPCSALHPWTNSCTYNAINSFLLSIQGGAKFFSVIYLFQLLIKHRTTKKTVLIQQLFAYCRSCIFCGFCCGSALWSMCFFRWLLGKYTPYTLGLIPGMIGGAGIFIEDPSRRGLDLTLFIALVSDLYLKIYHEEGFFIVSLPIELMIFTICSSCLLYCLRSVHSSYTILWPFTPHKLPEDPESRTHCAHKGSCLKDIMKAGTTYFCYGLVLQLFRMAALYFKKAAFKPLGWKDFFSINTLRLPLFAGLYVSLFKCISCLLRQYRGIDEAWHALPAGAVASLCYLVQPDFSLALLAFSNLSQIVSREYRKKILPEWPWEEVLFLVCMGLLFHARAAYPHCFPAYMFNLMDATTNGRARAIYALVDKSLVLRF